MKKNVLTVILFLISFTFNAQAQQPPLLNDFSFTYDSYNLTTCVTYTPNDTGTIFIQLQLAKDETGKIVIDQYFYPSADSGGGCFTITTLEPCTNYLVTLNMSNSHAYGPVSNPLFTFKSECNTSAPVLTMDDIDVQFQGPGVELRIPGLVQGLKAEVYNLLGQKVFGKDITANTEQFHLNAAPGMYVLRVSDDRQTILARKFSYN